MNTEKRALSAEEIRRLMGDFDPRQVEAWRAMTPARRLEMAFQA